MGRRCAGHWAAGRTVAEIERAAATSSSRYAEERSGTRIHVETACDTGLYSVTLNCSYDTIIVFVHYGTVLYSLRRTNLIEQIMNT